MAALIAVLSIVLVVVIMVVKKQSDHRTYLSYDVINEVTLGGNFSLAYETSAKGILRYSRDGSDVFGTDGKAVWNVAYNMNNPLADVCGNYVAIADIGAKNLYVFDGTGEVNKITTEYPIQDRQSVV